MGCVLTGKATCFLNSGHVKMNLNPNQSIKINEGSDSQVNPITNVQHCPLLAVYGPPSTVPPVRPGELAGGLGGGGDAFPIVGVLPDAVQGEQVDGRHLSQLPAGEDLLGEVAAEVLLQLVLDGAGHLQVWRDISNSILYD